MSNSARSPRLLTRPSHHAYPESLSMAPSGTSGEATSSPPLMAVSAASPEGDSRLRAGREDYFLWLVISGTLAAVFYFFYGTSSRLQDIISNNLSDIERSPVQLSSLLSILTIHSKNSAGLLVGTLLALIGTMIILRGVRLRLNAQIESSQARGSLTSDSAGLAIVLIGSALVALTIQSSPTFHLRGSESAPAANPPAGSSLSADQRRELRDLLNPGATT